MGALVAEGLYLKMKMPTRPGSTEVDRKGSIGLR
jgi:hypothetical protein